METSWSISIPLAIAIITISGMIIRAIRSKMRKECCSRFEKIEAMTREANELAKKSNDKADAANKRIDKQTDNLEKEIRAIQELMKHNNQNLEKLINIQLSGVEKYFDDKFNEISKRFDRFEDSFDKIRESKMV